MTRNEVVRAIEGIHKGSFTRIVYCTELPLTAQAKKENNELVKHTEKVVRFGVDYYNIAKVIAEEALRTKPKVERSSWCHWEIENLLAKHNTKDDYYLSFATVNHGSHTKNRYFLNGYEVSYQEVVNSGLVIPSYFNSNRDVTTIQKVNIKNIISIGGKR